MPYNIRRIDAADVDVLVYGYLQFLGAETYTHLRGKQFSFLPFHAYHHNVAAVRQGYSLIYNDSAGADGERFERLKKEQDPDIFKVGETKQLKAKETRYFPQENGDDCGFCAAWFIIYAIDWQLKNPEKDIFLLPKPPINPFSYKSNSSNKLKAPIATTFLRLVFYGHCLGLSFDFTPDAKQTGNYQLPDDKLVQHGSTIDPPTNVSGSRVIKEILTDLCAENKLSLNKIGEFIAAIEPLFYRKLNTVYENFILHRNIILYLLLHHFTQVNQLIENGKVSLLSYESMMGKIHPGSGKASEQIFKKFGTQSGYEAYAKEFFKEAGLADVKGSSQSSSYSGSHSSITSHSVSALPRSGGERQNEEKIFEQKDLSRVPLLSVVSEPQNYSSEASIEATRFKTILNGYATTAWARFFSCCVNTESETIQALQQLESKLTDSARVTEDQILAAIDKDPDTAERYKMLFLTGERGNIAGTADSCILELRTAFYR